MTVLEVGLSNALAALVLAVPAALVGRLGRRPALAHALWLLVLVKLITPPLFHWPMAWPGFAPPPLAVSPVAEEPANMEVEVLPGPLLDNADPEEAEEEAALPPPAQLLEPPVLDAQGALAAPVPVAEEPAPVLAQAVPVVSWDWRGGLLIVWLTGSAGWFVLAGWRVRRFCGELRCAVRAPEALQQRVGELAEQLGLVEAPEVWLVCARVPPLLWWLGGPAWLVLPTRLVEELNPAALDTLLLHELAHYRRRDHWVRVLELVVLGLYWWHPLAWYARRELREAEEQCCDSWVVTALPGSARTYAAALLDTLDFLAGADAAPLLVSGIGPVTDLKRRLTMIVRGVPPRALSRTAALVVLALGGLLLPWLPVWGQDRPKPAAPGNAAPEARPVAVDPFQPKAAPAPELAQLEAELKKLQADLEKKKAEIELNRARMELERARRVKELEAKRGEAAGGKLASGSVVIRIEITGLEGKPEELKEMLKKLEKELPGKNKVIILTAEDRRPTVAGMWGAMMGGAAKTASAPPGKTPPAAAGPTTPHMMFGPLPDGRLGAVEKKLDVLLKELEALRQELKSGRETKRP
jgi:beta-lactamase regulating signal transducer with metallopeptidase domain